MAVDFGKTFRLTGVLGCPLCRLRRRRLRRRRHSRRGILDFSSPRDWDGLFYLLLSVSMVRNSTRVFAPPLLLIISLFSPWTAKDWIVSLSVVNPSLLCFYVLFLFCLFRFFSSFTTAFSDLHNRTVTCVA